MYTYDRRTASGYSVKRMEPETILDETGLPSGRGTSGFKTPKGITYAVVDQHGKVVKTKNPVTHTMQYEIYLQKSTAQKVADHMNGRE